MPYIHVKATAKPDPALSARIALAITDLTRDHLRKDPAVTSVAIEFVEPSHWFIGGRRLTDHATGTYWLDIKVTAGTNTKPELAAYLEAVDAFMAEALGGIHEESYVLVHEVPAGAYGFGGKTQEFRFIAGKLARAA